VTESLTPHCEAKLRDATDAHRNDHNRARECRNEECDGDGDSSAHREEVNADILGVLGNEVNERYAKNDGHDDTDPRRRYSRVAKMFPPLLGNPVMVSSRLVTQRRCGRLQFVLV
jgi:hypothetical protein